VYALDAATGRLRWSYTTGWGVIRSSPAVAGRTVCVGGIDSKVHAPAAWVSVRLARAFRLRLARLARQVRSRRGASSCASAAGAAQSRRVEVSRTRNWAGWQRPRPGIAGVKQAAVPALRLP